MKLEEFWAYVEPAGAVDLCRLWLRSRDRYGLRTTQIERTYSQGT